MRKLLYSSFAMVCLLLAACQSIPVNGTQYKQTNHTQILGAMSSTKGNTITQNVTVGQGNLVLDKPLPVSAAKTFFTAKSFKAFKKTNTYQPANIQVMYSDSLKVKPAFVTLTLSNQAMIAQTINNDTNRKLQQYLQVNTQVGLVYSVSMLLPDNVQEAVLKADYLQLVQNKFAYYSLQLVTNNAVTQTIDFNEGVVFGYKYLYPCWQENTRHNMEVAGFTENTGGCPGGTYKKAEKARKKINIYKL